jgi:predicted outer membrane protein
MRFERSASMFALIAFAALVTIGACEGRDRRLQNGYSAHVGGEGEGEGEGDEGEGEGEGEATGESRRGEESLNDAQIAMVLGAFDQGEIAQARAAMPQVRNDVVRTFASDLALAHDKHYRRVLRWANSNDLPLKESRDSETATAASDHAIDVLKHARDGEADATFLHLEVVSHMRALVEIDTNLLPVVSNAHLRVLLLQTRAQLVAELKATRELVRKVGVAPMAD